jgi:hypothetical protein
MKSTLALTVKTTVQSCVRLGQFVVTALAEVHRRKKTHCGNTVGFLISKSQTVLRQRGIRKQRAGPGLYGYVYYPNRLWR